jgi:hypothetical protein
MVYVLQAPRYSQHYLLDCLSQFVALWEGPQTGDVPLRNLMAQFNEAGKRCALVDFPGQCSTAAWKLLARSGMNWLTRPCSLYVGYLLIQGLVQSAKFPLVIIYGTSMLPEAWEDRLMKEAVHRGVYLLLLDES